MFATELREMGGTKNEGEVGEESKKRTSTNQVEHRKRQGRHNLKSFHDQIPSSEESPQYFTFSLPEPCASCTFKFFVMIA